MYLALYRKYRPRTFEDVISQPHITTTLKNEIAQDRTAHAYLFTGPRGTGKTTCSKILAMAVNCEHPVDGNPCLECATCRGIESGSILDVVEIDAASNNGVDNIRQLRDEANYTPSQCKYRVYIIDETHMLSAGAFNALLKIMEEPPEHVKFILATTEAHKVPATILSRCQRFDFRRIRPEDIEERLLKIAASESFTLEQPAAELIARLADGGMRDALSILDQCAAFSDRVDLDTVIQAAGVVGRDYLYELTDCIVRGDASAAVLAIDRLYSMAKDMQGLLEEMIHHFRNIMLTQTLKRADGLVAALPDEQERLNGYARKLPLSTVLWAIGEMQECLDKMGRSYDRRLTLELCFVRLCTPSMNLSNDALLSRLDRLEVQLKNGVIATPALASVQSASAPVAVPGTAELAPPTELAKALDEAVLTDSLIHPENPKTVDLPAEQPEGLPESLFSSPGPPVSAPENSGNPLPEELPPTEEVPPVEIPPAVRNASEPDSSAQPAPLPAPDDDGEVRSLMEWADILAELSKTDMPLCGVLKGSRAFVGGGFLYLDSALSLAGTMLKQEGNAAKLIAAVEARTGRRYKIRVKSAPSAAAPKKDKLSALLEAARSSGVEVHEES